MSELPTAEETLAILEGKTEDTPIPDKLFGEVVETIRRHFYFEEGWHYVVASLFVFQAQIAMLLPAVFYIFIGGAFGRGKTALLSLLAKLTDGLLFENVSLAGLARSMENGKTVCLDEIDVSRGKDKDEARDALLRSGYKRDAPPYVRWDPTRRAREEVPIYGPKAAAFRGILDDALQSRGFVIPTARLVGEEGFEYVLANFWPDLRGLPERLQTWGQEIREVYSENDLREIAHSESFRGRMREAVLELGANRESEIGAIALLVAHPLGISVEEELRRASELTQTLTGEGTAAEKEELAEVLLDLAGPLQEKLLEEAPEVRLKQTAIKHEVNRRRKDRGEPIYRGHKRFSVLRRELGIKDAWLRTVGGCKWWAVPAPFLEGIAPKPPL